MNIYWGDLHNHCGITYGFGSLEHAIERAKASWISAPLPDMLCGRICTKSVPKQSLL